MSGSPAIRSATFADLPRLKEIIDISFPWYFRYFAAHSVSDLEEPTLVYDAASGVVAFAKLIQFTIQRVRYGCIFWIAVDPHYRQQGIALALTNAGLEWQRNHGAKAVFASTQRSNKAALATLGKAGFTRMGFGALRRLFGWRVLQFSGNIWLAPGEVVLARF